MGARRKPEPRAPRGPRLPAWLNKAAGTANRLASSKLARTLVTLTILVLAAWLIRGELQSSRFSDVTHAIAATPPWAIGLCGLFTLGAYLCLGVLDWHALRFIGQRLPIGRTLLAASGASALAIAMGFGLASGTAARLRFYAFARLDAAAVAKVNLLVSGAVFLAGLISLGLSGFGGAGVISGLLHWSTTWVTALSIVLLAPLPAWFLLLRKWPGHEETALGPAGRSATLAAALGAWLFQGAALFVLAHQDIMTFPGFFAAFALASLFGSAVGVPADLGVLDAAVIGSHSLGSAHQAAAALVLYRLIFQLIPLILAAGSIVLRPMARAASKALG
jgi:phosphatidylglycerol lysyltransferase